MNVCTKNELSDFSTYQLNAHFLYVLTIYMSHYNPQHVTRSTLYDYNFCYED